LEVARYAEEDPLVGNPTELSELLKKLSHEPDSPETISAVLRNYGFKTKSCRKNGGDAKYRYELPKAALAEILERYGAPDLRPEIEEEDVLPVEVVDQATPVPVVEEGGGMPNTVL
jgi:hypothetical protein